MFFGDSITDLCGLRAPTLFTSDVINRGRSSHHTTAQMLGRFRADVIALRPRAVHILAGTNDIAGNTGPTTLGWLENNIATMAELAQAHGIQVALAAAPPAARFGWRPALRLFATIITYNVWLREYAALCELVFIDHYVMLDDGHGGFAARSSDDGIHPNTEGYAVMRRRSGKPFDDLYGASRGRLAPNDGRPRGGESEPRQRCVAGDRYQECCDVT